MAASIAIQYHKKQNTAIRSLTYYGSILAVKKEGHLNIETKISNTLREYSLASQSERVAQNCFYVKVACLSYGEYNISILLSGIAIYPYCYRE